MDMMKIGQFIANRRKELGLTQEGLAQSVGVTDKAVSKWERGLSFPDVSLLNCLSITLKCSISDILNSHFRNTESSNLEREAEKTESLEALEKYPEPIVFDFGSSSMVSPFLFGNNLEHTRNSVHKGISAEMLENRKFAGKPGANNGCATHWAPEGQGVYCSFEAPYTRHAKDYHMKRDLECNAQRITSFSEGEECGICQSGLQVEKDKAYQFSIAVKAAEKGSLKVSLSDQSGEMLCEGSIVLDKSAEFAEKELTLTPCRDVENANIRITFSDANTVIIGAVSLLPADHFRGMRYDVIERMKEMGIRILRWPGGNFAGEYNWKDGLLPRNMRAPLQSYLGLETQPHSMGYDFHEINTDDFIALCKEIGAEPFITLNPTWNTPEESAQWVEYCNGDETTEYGRLRISRGFTEPYHVSFWSLGNEFGYGHMEGANAPYDYSKTVRQHAEAMSKITPNLTFCSSGPYPDKEWTQYSAKVLSDIAPLVSLHFYNEYPQFMDPAEYKKEYQKFMEGVIKARKLARTLRADLSNDKIRISFDEWNAWYAWYRPESVCDGMFAAAMLHMFMNEAEQSGIDIVCHFEAVNEGAIIVAPNSSKLTPMGKMFSVMKSHALGRLLFSNDEVIATQKEDIITTSLINLSYDEEKEYQVPACGEIVEATLYHAQSILPHSKFEESALVCQKKDGYYLVKMPPHSVALVKQKGS